MSVIVVVGRLLTSYRIRRTKTVGADAEIKAQRGGEARGPRFRCEHAGQSVEENLTKFRDMRDGKYKPREAMSPCRENMAG